MTIPEAGFYLWPQLPSDDQAFTRALFEKTHVTVLPGSFLSRDAHGINPGHRHIRIALVPPLEACVEAAERIRQFIQTQPTFSG
jgi:N-succinyldiaminopimelate aminotransferase